MNHQQADRMLTLLESIDKRLAGMEDIFGSGDKPPRNLRNYGALDPAAELAEVKRIAGAFAPLIDTRRLQPGTAGQMRREPPDAA